MGLKPIPFFMEIDQEGVTLHVLFFTFSNLSRADVRPGIRRR